MRIVVLDGATLNPGDNPWTEVAQLGKLIVHDRTPEDQIIPRSQGAQILVTNKVPFTAATLAALPDLRFIAVTATGYNVVDTAAARARSIPVANVPVYSTDSVAQLVFALLLEMCHHVWAHSEEVKKGAWTNCPDFCFWNYPLIELAGKTMGIIGFGRIGQATAKIAQAMGMKVLVYDTHKNERLENDNLKYVELDELLAESDIISLHCSLLESTKGLINKSTIVKMKDGVKIINASRGPLIVEEDLAEALNSGKVSGAAVDVVSTEPATMDNPLLSAKNCIVTPHIAWAPKESRERLMNIAMDNLEKFLTGNSVNVVNK
jgi:glycerate dehydrogenase